MSAANPEVSQRKFKHANKPGRVTVPGKPSDELVPGRLRDVWPPGQPSKKLNLGFARPLPSILKHCARRARLCRKVTVRSSSSN